MSSKWLALAKDEGETITPSLTFDKIDKTPERDRACAECPNEIGGFRADVLSDGSSNPLPDRIDKTPPKVDAVPFCPVLSKSQGDASAISADDMRHGFAGNGQPKTWTGEVVKLGDWRGLSEWQKHGPNGRMWCGVCKAWVKNCSHAMEGEQ